MSHDLKTNIERIKTGVDLAEHARRYTELRRCGQTLRGRCPIHKGDNPSAFAVYPNGWHCFRCAPVGVVRDVVGLHAMIHACEVWAAVEELADLYGVELERGRTVAWHRAHRRKANAADRVEAAVVERLQRRVFDVLAAPYLAYFREDGDAADALWRVCGHVAADVHRDVRREKTGGGDAL